MDAQSMGDERRRTDRGRFGREVSDEELLAAVRERGGAGTAALAEAVGLSRDACLRRLKQLADDGRLRRIGDAAYVWIVTDADCE